MFCLFPLIEPYNPSPPPPPPIADGLGKVKDLCAGDQVINFQQVIENIIAL